ncbi:hypothetical protein AZE42_06759 [Rhizopogon vesiculosus]|uniref:Uncharacterized protein n=1 Tax=Rhizopogon vesiculosus TaxID=180088 RepID=A0A1J8PIL8_9AGAM|nr:hypothetical protein AZE42_06759 [Rhizopogon vesiculosus]
MAGRISNAADIMQANAYYLRCRDVDGTSVIITPTATGLGAHTRWIYPEHEVNEEDVENAMDVDEEEDIIEDRIGTPPPTMKQMPETPMAQHTFDAGSVIRTPVKKPQPLQRSPERIGFNGIDFWHDNSLGKRTVEQGPNGPCVRYVLERPVGSVTNLSQEQILEHEFQRNHATFLSQVEKLLGREEREKVTREMKQPLSAVDGPCGVRAAGQVHFGMPQPTIIIEEEDVAVGPTEERINAAFKRQVHPRTPRTSQKQPDTEKENAKHLGSITIEGKEWQVYKTLRPRKDGQPRIIRSSPASPKTRRARKSVAPTPSERRPAFIDVK